MRARFDTALASLLLAYIAYAQITGDGKLLRLRRHVGYQWGRLGRWWRQSNEPAWKQELRQYNVDNDAARTRYVPVDLFMKEPE